MFCVNDAGSCLVEVISGETCTLINPQAIRIFKTELEDACIEIPVQLLLILLMLPLLYHKINFLLILTPKNILGSPSENTGIR